jgi:hypothetical protein
LVNEELVEACVAKNVRTRIQMILDSPMQALKRADEALKRAGTR